MNLREYLVGYWKSPKSVKREYLRYAFAMEGSVKDPLKGTEVRFHSCDRPYLVELKHLLSSKFSVESAIYEYFIEDYGWKYYLSFSSKENVTKFYKQVGFALDSHQERLQAIVENFKSRAREMTLVQLLTLNQTYFRIKDANKLFPLCKRAVHHRLTELVKRGYLNLTRQGYALTDKGQRKAISFKGQVKITPLRTKSKENEARVMSFVRKKGRSYTSEISRELIINSVTVRDTLKRLLGQNKLKLVGNDQFGRKFYEAA